MNITFLIGNGFDLNCGLKSSYQDVYNEYCKINETDSELIKNFKKNIKNDYKTWGDFELAMAEKINDFKSENDFVKCIIDFKTYLVKYLSEEKRKFFEKYNTDSIKVDVYNEVLNSIRSFYKNNTNNISNSVYKQIFFSNINYTFVSFNYTCIFNEIFNSFSKEYKRKFINIHGSLEDNDVVLGIDNEQQLKSKNFKISDSGRISFIKPIFNNRYDIDRVIEANNAILESDIICIYGMSLGDSDLTWKNLIIKWLDSVLSENDKHLFVYDYENCKKNIIFKDQQIIEEEKVKEKFITRKLKIEGTNNKFKKYFDKIHMQFKNIFNINEIVNRTELMRIKAYNQQIKNLKNSFNNELYLLKDKIREYNE